MSARRSQRRAPTGPEDDAAPFLFFEAGTTVFFPCEDDIVYGRSLGHQNRCCRRRKGVGVGCVKLQRLSHARVLWACGCTRPCLASFASPTLWCEEFTLLIPAINVINIRFKTSIVYLQCAEFGMNYLDCTIWENTEYRKRNFFIRFRSGKARICCI
ncbi:hypothetical protein GOBAR_AA24228 [Gossypium barbadense]|uniref:Uncharacterized protein n=1 Tax=Gossypium barbadense TaxID=3634 RepID=A0A2P5WZD0_GOSBA|nr:hypothetical protein GOBAR_AA24228 [Gossypium barbadense]